MTFITLSNDPSDVSGYLKAYINGRSPNATSAYIVATTTVAAGVLTTVANLTLTAGGSQAKWLTAPLEADVQIEKRAVAVNLWGHEDAAATDAQFAFRLNEYTTSEQSAFYTTSNGVELGTASGTLAPRIAWSPGSGRDNTEGAPTVTTIDAGNRLAITPGYTGVHGGTNTVAGTCSLYYGATVNTTGDTYLIINESLRAGDPQLGDGSSPGIKGKGKSYFLDLANTVQNGVDEGLFTSDATAQAIIDEGNTEAAVS